VKGLFQQPVKPLVSAFGQKVNVLYAGGSAENTVLTLKSSPSELALRIRRYVRFAGSLKVSPNKLGWCGKMQPFAASALAFKRGQGRIHAI
jgi:hypothetical protein